MSMTMPKASPKKSDYPTTSMRQIVRLGGVSALLASLEEEVNRRHPEDRMRRWELLLPIARAVVWEEHVRYGETLDVYTNLDDGEYEFSYPFEPIIYARSLTMPCGYAEWHVDSTRNKFADWNREVRG